jgi:hypothetical protein
MLTMEEMSSTPILWKRGQRNVLQGLVFILVASSQELTVILSYRDGAPYCEKDYQGLFGVKCEACNQFITGKVLEVSDRWAPFKATIIFLRSPQKCKETACSSILSSPVEERKKFQTTCREFMCCGVLPNACVELEMMENLKQRLGRPLSFLEEGIKRVLEPRVYMCTCVCVCVCVYRPREQRLRIRAEKGREGERQRRRLPHP